MFLVVIGALLGALFGGIAGLLIGAALGYVAGFALRQSVIGGLRVVQSQLIESTFAVMGALCKSDSVVTRDEIDAVEKIFTMLRLQEEQRLAAKAAFNRGKQPGFDLDGAVDQFARVSRRRAPLVQLFLQLQVKARAFGWPEIFDLGVDLVGAGLGWWAYRRVLCYSRYLRIAYYILRGG